MPHFSAGGPCVVRIAGLPGYYGLNARDGTRLITTRGLMSLRAVARDYYFIDALPPFRGDAPSDEEQASLAAPLLTDGYGRLLAESEDA